MVWRPTAAWGAINPGKVDPPWFQWFPIDFITEHLWPWTLTDTHEVNVSLPRLDVEELRARVKALHARESSQGADR